MLIALEHSHLNRVDRQWVPTGYCWNSAILCQGSMSFSLFWNNLTFWFRKRQVHALIIGIISCFSEKKIVQCRLEISSYFYRVIYDINPEKRENEHIMCSMYVHQTGKAILYIMLKLYVNHVSIYHYEFICMNTHL